MPRFRRIVAKERRKSRRIPASKVIPQRTTRLATGQEVGLLNLALDGGILISSRTMLSPGSPVRLKLTTPESVMILEGRVHRCRVVGLKQAKIQYEAAIITDNGFPEPLAEKLRSLDEGSAPSEQGSQGLNPEAVSLSETAQLWILNGEGAAAIA